MKNAILLFCTAFLLNHYCAAQTVNKERPWNNKKCAVVLTYDDALHVHLDNAIPLLDSLNLKATFYLTAFAPACKNRIGEWKKAAASGHELGNHTLYHPCAGNIPGREWVQPEYDLSRYTLPRLMDEIRMTNVFLQSVDGKTNRTFAYTCGEMKIGDSSFVPLLKNDFVAARAVHSQMHQLGQIDLLDVDCYLVNGESGEQMIKWVKKAAETHSLLVFLFHGVGGEHGLNVSLPAHRELLQFLKKNEQDIWVAPMVEVAEYIKNTQAK